jgi:hypothetical protein
MQIYTWEVEVFKKGDCKKKEEALLIWAWAASNKNIHIGNT